MTSIPLILSQEQTCSYLPHQNSRSIFIYPSYPLTTSIYSQLLDQGFRRSGNQVYRPNCSDCAQCIAVRIPVSKFKPSRQQKRTLKKNQNITIKIKPPIFEQQHFELYQRYQNTRHKDGEMADSSPNDYMRFLSSSWCNTLFVEFMINNELFAVAVVDRLDNALSAVYSFFDPDFSSFSPGVFAVLWQLQYARQLKLGWLYLGYWIKSCQKMSYKTNFRPIQGFINNQWQFLI